MSGRKFNLMDPEPDVTSEVRYNTERYPALPMSCPSHLPACLCTAYLPPQPCPSPLGAHQEVPRYPDTLAASKSRA